ncbi:MAG: hypothetical protein HYU41_04925 [Candidatus Rokubacteria bacterium]|nr:hypothetical protein [Candidatus Rokubacteria bacterium]
MKLVRIDGWPLSRTIHVVGLTDHLAPKAAEHFLLRARKEIPDGRFTKVPVGSSLVRQNTGRLVR